MEQKTFHEILSEFVKQRLYDGKGVNELDEEFYHGLGIMTREQLEDVALWEWLITNQAEFAKSIIRAKKDDEDKKLYYSMVRDTWHARAQLSTALPDANKKAGLFKPAPKESDDQKHGVKNGLSKKS